MAKAPLTNRKSSPDKPKTVAEKRVRDNDGQVRTVWSLDVSSPTFGAELHYVFRKNVAKARRENKRVTGAADVAVSKR